MAVQAGRAGNAAQTSWLAATGVALAVVIAVNATAGDRRWWANFVLLPGAAVVAAAVPLLRARRTAAGYAVLCAGGLIGVVGALLMFGRMGRGWPLMIVLPCLAVAGTARWRAGDAAIRAVHRTVVGLAGLGALLGVTFLALRAGWVDFGDSRWWGSFMIAAGLIGLGNGLALLGDVRGYRVPTAVLLAGPGAGAVLAGLRELFWR
jgi:hypothetical protein